MLRLCIAGFMLMAAAACVSAPTTQTADVTTSVASAEADNIVTGEDGKQYKIVRTVSAVGDPNEEICKVDSMTGSRVRKHKVCLTRGEWKELADANTHDMMNRSDSFSEFNE